MKIKLFNRKIFNSRTVEGLLLIKLGTIGIIFALVLVSGIYISFYLEKKKDIEYLAKSAAESLYLAISVNGFDQNSKRMISFLSNTYNIKNLVIYSDDGIIRQSNKGKYVGLKVEDSYIKFRNLNSGKELLQINGRRGYLLYNTSFSLSNHEQFKNINIALEMDVADKLNELLFNFLYVIIFFLSAFILSFVLLNSFIKKDILNPIKTITDWCYAWGQGLEIEPNSYEGNEDIKAIYDQLTLMVQSIREQRENLLDANMRIKEGSELKTRFLANMSHEIRTPLNSIIGCTEILIDDREINKILKSGQFQLIRDINTSGKILLNIINDILDMSKIESNKLQLESVDFCLNDVLNDIKRIFKNQFYEKGLEFIFNCPRENVYLNGDPLRISQIFINIINNAYKFTEHGRVTFNLSTYLVKEDYRIEVEISDTGIGMSPDAQSRLFQPFEQANISDSRKFGGTGLGLSICLHLIEMMKGDIEVKSVEGEGSTFKIGLYLSKSKKEQYTPRINTNIIDELFLADLKILIAEDNIFNQRVLAKYIEKFGGQADLVSDGVEAKNSIKENKYDLIFMDIQMPRVSGIELTKQIREEKNEVIIIGASANAYQENIDEALASGMNYYISKPITLNKLKALFEKMKSANHFSSK